MYAIQISETYMSAGCYLTDSHYWFFFHVRSSVYFLLPDQNTNGNHTSGLDLFDLLLCPKYLHLIICSYMDKVVWQWFMVTFKKWYLGRKMGGVLWFSQSISLVEASYLSVSHISIGNFCTCECGKVPNSSIKMWPIFILYNGNKFRYTIHIFLWYIYHLLMIQSTKYGISKTVVSSCYFLILL